MAKQNPTKKKTTKKTTKKSSGAAAKSKPAAKKTTKKKTAKASKKTTKKVVKKVTKKVAKKKAAKKVTKKPAAKKISKKKVAKKTAKKTVTKKTPTKKVAKKTTKKKAPATSSKKSTKKTAPKTTKKTSATKTKPKSSKTSSPAQDAPAPTKSKSSAPAAKDTKAPSSETENQKGGSNKRRRSSRVKKPLVLPDRPLLLGPNGPALKPLIQSTKKRKTKASVLENITSRRTKTPLTKSQLEHFRHLLLVKRAELMGDVKQLEQESSRSEFGAGSASQQIDEAGAENYEQSLIMNIASSDRERINEINDALKRIVDRTYGLCELTHEPISKDRLEVIPWARYTIAAAKELEKRNGRI